MQWRSYKKTHRWMDYTAEKHVCEVSTQDRKVFAHHRGNVYQNVEMLASRQKRLSSRPQQGSRFEIGWVVAGLPNRCRHTRRKRSRYRMLEKYISAIYRHSMPSEILSPEDQHRQRNLSIYKMPTIEAPSVLPSSEFAQPCDVFISVGNRSDDETLIAVSFRV